jgi:hypothetical protein
MDGLHAQTGLFGRVCCGKRSRLFTEAFFLEIYCFKSQPILSYEIK